MTAPRAVELVLASGNAKKLAELRRVVAPLGAVVLSPADVGGLPEVIEDGATFAANAAKKARRAALACGRLALADDSGLCVDALGGAPGVFSARYAGTHGDDEANNAKLLRELRAADDRGAAFRCALALATPHGEIAAETEGEVRGSILEERIGEGGFGYDPLFELVEPGHALHGRPFATLTPEEKASVSHRGRALRALLPALERALRGE